MAMENVVKSLNLLVTDQVDGSQLVSNYTGWDSYHFQSKRVQGQRADLRIVFQRNSGLIRVRGFGNRWVPVDIYQRLRPRE
ncbi:hypothetical protein [Virgibacillus doumboii]|uniref:hypothetical protein n=1 Tax=Virgibacillus doumboii TaxID=2697503 RepID=UPI0019673650|nr:hypothetical protein [Virgibacillus doumboii]